MVDPYFQIDAKHVVHISLTEGMDPIGSRISILEPTFKVSQTKELLEDPTIIYRVHRALKDVCSLLMLVICP